MKKLILMTAAAGLWALGVARAELEATPLNEPIQAGPGLTVLVQALIENPTDEVVYINSASTDLDSLFGDDQALDDFAEAGPDSLLPGEGWEGPLVRLVISPAAPVHRDNRIGVVLYGGSHPYDDQELIQILFSLDDSTHASGVPEEDRSPRAMVLAATPNPMRETTSIRFALERPQAVLAQVFDLRGAPVRALFHGSLPAGPQAITWDGRDDLGAPVPPGLYFVRVQSDEGVRRTKVIRVH